MKLEQDVEMKYGVLYSVDVPSTVSLRPHLPSKRHLFDTTEGNECYEYDYLEGAWEKGKHRKLIGVLTQEQFDEFVEELGLFAEDVETLGSLGVPWAGCGGLGVAPAISFISEDPEAIQGAYVTPIPQCDPPEDEEEMREVWEELKRKIVEKYKP